MNIRIASTLLSLAALAAGCATTQKPDGLLFYCTFDDEASITTPAVGPAGKIDDKPTFVPGKVGKAIQSKAAERAAIFELPAGSLGERGCIEFWAKIVDPNLSSLPDRGSPIFFTFGPEDIPNVQGGGYINWNGNDGLGGSGLCGWMHGARLVCIDPCHHGKNGSVYGALLGDAPGEWHHYALTWDSKGLDQSGHQVLIILDNRVVATADKMNPDVFTKTIKHPSLLSIPINKNKFMLRRGVEMDEFKIWNTAKTSFNIN